ncbi:MAG: TetR/AcrR family transcriptional regulator, partial [Lachnospiraceae bacterium]|nr:TetR/AcrR family transcriptional regulator [Lachnospiraceae bacterium]
KDTKDTDIMPENLQKSEMEKHKVLRLSNQESNRLTRECLEIAMIRLLAEKDIEKISITELVKVAGVSRTAFYSNYSTKEDVLSSLLNQMGNDFVNLIWPYIEKQDYKELFRQLLLRIKEESGTVKIFAKAGMHHRLSIEMENAILKKTPDLTRREKYIITGFFGMFVNILMEWLRNDMEDDIDELSDICNEIFFIAFKQMDQKRRSQE